MDFASCLERLRTALAKGPSGLSVAEWAERAGVSPSQLYEVSLGQDSRMALATAAAGMLGWDPAQLEAWFLLGQDVPDLEHFLAELPNLARCAGPDCKGRWHKRSEIVKGLSRCKACCRLQKRNPQADAIFDIAYQKLPQIRAAYPAFARALETCLSDRSRALTTARVQRIMCISRLRAEMLMKEHGLDKAAVAVAAKSYRPLR